MAWILLIIAGVFEVAFTTCMSKAKEASGMVAFYWFIAFLVTMSTSLYLLYRATLTLPMGTAYAVWTGIGAVGTVLVGILVFKEPATFWRMFFILLLISSIIGLKVVSKH